MKLDDLRCKVAWCRGIYVHAPECPEDPGLPRNDPESCETKDCTQAGFHLVCNGPNSPFGKKGEP